MSGEKLPALEPSLENFQKNLKTLGIATPQGGQAAVLSPTRGGIQDWMDFPQVVAAYVQSFPHQGPQDPRTDDWEAQMYPSRNPRTKRPRGPGESVLLS